jgi:hypothetical protein
MFGSQSGCFAEQRHPFLLLLSPQHHGILKIRITLTPYLPADAAPTAASHSDSFGKWATGTIIGSVRDRSTASCYAPGLVLPLAPIQQAMQR